MRKSILFWLAFAFAILIALYLAVRISMTVLGIGNIVPIGSVSIRARGLNSAADIAGVFQTQSGRSAYSIDLDDYLLKITELPDVHTAAIRKHPNGRLEIKVVPRRIVANWTDGGKFYPLDSNGKTINRPEDARAAGMLVFSGALPDNIVEISDIIKSAPIVFSETDTVSWIEGRRWNLVTKGGITVRLPESGVKSAISKLSLLQKQNSILNRDILVIDMRDADRVLVKLK
jgi:cell division protein FtsQ